MDKSFLIFLAIPLFFVMMLIELAYGLLRGRNNYRLNDAVTSINIGLISRFPTILNLGFQGVIFAYAAESLNLRLLPENSAFTYVFAFVFYDFCYYWMHRFHHEYKFLWGTHVVHHHGEEFNLATAMRQTSTGFLWKWIFFVPMMMVGVPAAVFVTVGGLNLVYQFWVHTEHIPKLGWYEKIFITPSNHRIHHAKNPEYIDANYGGVFIIWDRMFGTFIEERDDLKPVYGTVKPLRSWNPLWANVEIFVHMARDSFHTERWSDKVKVWFAPTKWRPADVAERFPSAGETIDFHDKFDSKISMPYQAFIWVQTIMNPVIGMMVFLTVKDQAYLETAIFGGLLIAGVTSISVVLMGNQWGLISESVRAMVAVYLCWFSGLLNPALPVTQAILLQALVNLALVLLIFSLGSRQAALADRKR